MTQAKNRAGLGTLAALLAVACLHLTGAPPARAEEAPGKPQTYVVVVGVAAYPDPQIKPRPHGEDDAKALFQLFTARDTLGVPADHARLLLGSGEGDQKATHDNILKALKWLAEQAKPQDTVLFAFFGEGGPLGKTGDRRCYFAVDSTFKGRDKDAIGADEIAEIFKGLKARHVAAFLDVNFKGFDPLKEAIPEPTLGEVPYVEFLGDDESDDHNILPGRVLYLATNGLSPSLDLKEHGVFAKVVLDGLKGAADKQGYEPDGLVTCDELADYLEKELPEVVRKFGATPKEKEQIAVALGAKTSHFVLTYDPAAKAKADARVAKFDTLAKSGKVPEALVEEGRGLLERMPRLKAQQSLRKLYQDFTDGEVSLDQLKDKRTAILDATRLTNREAVLWAEKILDVTDMVGAEYVKETNQGDLVAWAIRGLYRVIDEKIPEALDTKLKGVKTMDADALKVLLAEARKHLGKREDLDNHKDLDITLKQMLRHLDPYTTYFDPEEVAKLEQDLRGNFSGIGIQIRKDAATDYLLVVTPIKGSPAYKAGLQAGDLITTVTRPVDSDGKALSPPEVLQTKGLPLKDAVKKILGKEGTEVILTVQREGKAKPFDVEITRGKVEVETVLGIKRNKSDDWDFMLDPVSKIGYVRLTQFSRNSYRDLKAATDELKEAGAKGLVFDLRFNPGGLLPSAVDITNLFVDDGVIVEIRPRTRPKQVYRARKRPGILTDMPMVCLVNGYSASASEIVSAALQDHKRALIVGERSYGKGSVQNVVELPIGGELKMTVATFWRPSGKNLNKASTSGKPEDTWGVTPDRVVELTRDERVELAEYQRDQEIIQPKGKTPKESTFKDKQLEEALKYLREQIKMAEAR